MTSTVNVILAETKKKRIDVVKLFQTLMDRNIMIIIGLYNLMLPVTLATINVVSPAIVDQGDLNILINNVNNEHYTNSSISELKNLSTIKVHQMKIFCIL